MEKDSKEINDKELKAEVIENKKTEENNLEEVIEEDIKEEKVQDSEGETKIEKELQKNENMTENEKKDKANFEEKIEEKKHGKKWIGITAVILVALAILSTGFALININNENIIAGVMVDNVKLQGLTVGEAKSVLNKKVEDKLNQEIKIRIDNDEQSLLLSQIELEYDVDNAVELAYKIGRKGNIFVNNFDIIQAKFFGLNIDLNTLYNEEILENVISEIKSKIPNGVKEVDFCIEDESLIITKGTPGLAINEEELKQKLKESMNLNNNDIIELNTYNAEPKDINIEEIYQEVHTEAQDAYYTKDPFQVFAEVLGVDFDIEEAKRILEEEKEEYVIPLKITKPNKTVNQIGTEAFPDLLSTFSTRYDASNTSRTTNLKIAVNKINGVVVMPGETFSYNKTLGKRTSEAGYKDAAGYSGGKVVQMIGGGICQISSTLYDAVVYANLEIVERHNHAFLTSYVGAGKDATVVYGALDFQFRNTRNYPITIKASAQNGIAKIDIYGIKEDNEYEIEIYTTILNYIPYSVKYEDDVNLAEGVEKVTQYGSQGCKSITYKIFKLNGAEISREVLSTDTYDAMNKYITRGTKKAISTAVEPAKTEEQPTQETSTKPNQPTTQDNNTEATQNTIKEPAPTGNVNNEKDETTNKIDNTISNIVNNNVVNEPAA